MANIDYPCKLPGVLINSNGYTPQNTVRRNDLQSGAPIFRLESDEGWELFDVSWRFNALETQVFRNFHKNVLARGSRLFNIELWVDGYDGDKQTKTHECYFNDVPSYRQNGRLFVVSATLLAIAPQILDECNGTSLVNAYSGFDDLPLAMPAVDGVINTLESLWLP